MRRCVAAVPWPPSSGRMEPSALQFAAWLCEALRSEEDTVVEALLQQGANPNLVLPEGMAPIHLVAGMEQESGIRCLTLILQYGGDPNSRSVDDLTPLHVAASWGCYTCLRLLLMEGGDPQLEDQDGNTALDLALEQGNEMCVRILREALEEQKKEQSSWMSHRRAESFLSTVTADTIEDGVVLRPCEMFFRTSNSSPNGSLGHSFFPQPVVAASGANPDGCVMGSCLDEHCSRGLRHAASFLTECSSEGTTVCDDCEIPTQLAASSNLPFGHVGRKQVSNRSARGGFPEDGTACPKLDTYERAMPSCFLKTTTGEGCRSSPDQNSVLPKATLISSESRAAELSPEIPCTTRSQEIFDPPPTCAFKSECEIDRSPGMQSANTTLNLTQYSSFLDPELVVKLSSRQGLDVTSPDHVYLFSQGDATTVSDLEKTLVVEKKAILSKVCGNPDRCGTREKPFRRSSDNTSSQYLSCSSECDASASEVPDGSEVEQKASFGCSPGSSDRSQALLSQTSDEPCGSGEHLEASPVAAMTVSPSRPQTLQRSQADLRETPSRTPRRGRTSGLCSTGRNGCPGNGREQDLSLTFQEEVLGKRGNQDLNTIQSQGPQKLMIPKAVGHVLGEYFSIAQSKQVAAQQLQGEFGAAVPSDVQLELNEEDGAQLRGERVLEKGESLQTQDTVLVQRTSEEMRALLDGETVVSPGMSEEAGDTVPVSRQIASVAEEELSSLDAKLRSMMLATKACHSPLLQPKQGSCCITRCPKSRTATSAARDDHSSSSSLFDETLEMPRRPRRVRSPEGKALVSEKARERPVRLRDKSPPHVAGEETGLQDDTRLLSAGPSSCKPHSSPGSVPLAPSMAVLTESGRDDCRGDRWLEVTPGFSCSADSEVKSPSKLIRPSPDIREEHDTVSDEIEAALSWTSTKQSPDRHNKRTPKPTRVSFSRLSARQNGPSFIPGATSCPSRRLSPVGQAVLLSPGGRPMSISATEPVEYLYVDEDEGHSLVERHVPCTDDSISNATSSEDTIIYDWRAYATQAAGLANRGKSSSQVPSELCGHLSDEALVQKLRDLGVNPGPITGLTRKVYAQLLEKLMSDPKTKARKDSAGYSPELTFTLETYQIPDGKDDEMALARQFDQPDKSKKWREGLLKSSFNYLLLDPRVTQNLPFRSQYVSQAECFRTFISAVFYVGKGKRSRPYSHLYEALTHYKRSQRKQAGRLCPKVQHILEIWASGQGVISMHCFQNVIPVEAYTREACMVDAIGLKMLTNQKKGNYYGLVAGWPMKRRRRLGIYLLQRAMQIFLAEGERQLRPADIQPGQ